MYYKKLNRMATWCFFPMTSVPGDTGLPLRGCEGPGLKLTWNPSDRWICYGTDEGQGRWVDVTVLLQWSHLWYQLLLHSQLSPPPLCHHFLHLTSLQREDGAAPRPRNVSPRRAWHLQIRAHYLGVTCPVPFKYHREGRMCVCFYALGVLWTISQLFLDLK